MDDETKAARPSLSQRGEESETEGFARMSELRPGILRYTQAKDSSSSSLQTIQQRGFKFSS